MSILDKIGSLRRRLRERVGRSFGHCDECGKPTRSHVVGGQYHCHRCYSGGNVVLADGGFDDSRVEKYLENNPDADVPEVAGALGASPAEVADVLGEDVPEPETQDGEHETADILPDVDFSRTHSGVYPDAMLEREQWMGHREKKPFAPWAGKDHPAAEPDEDARFKWGIEDNYVDGETVAMAEVDPRLDGRAYLQQPDDPIVHVDGDDVRDPETGEIHPAFAAILSILGPTFTEVSQSGTGVHAYFFFESFPVKEANWRLGDVPWGSNDKMPEVEIYPGKRVCVVTGEHVLGTPTEVRGWNQDVIDPILEANGQFSPGEGPSSDPPSTERGDYDLDSYEPAATSAEDTTSDIRDIFAAEDRINAQRVAAKTIVHAWNDSVSTSGDERAFYPTWGRNSNGRANIVNRDRWQDTGGYGGYGGPICMAAIDAGLVTPDRCPNAVRGQTWWRAVDHLRSLGFPIPEYESDDWDESTHPMVEAAEGERDPGYVSALPLEKLSALSPQQRREYARRRGKDWPSTEEARESLFDEITEAMADEEAVVVEAPTALGKSHATASAPWGAMDGVTGGQQVVKLSETRDARDESRETAREAGTDAMALLSRKEACPCAAGEHDKRTDAETITIDGESASSFIDRICDGKSLPFSLAHRKLHENNDQGVELPCMRGDTGCLAITQYDALREGDHDLVIATHNFSYVPSLRMHTHVIVDEKPDFSVDMGQERIQRAVSSYLRHVDAPVSTWESFIGLARSDAWGTDAGWEKEQLQNAVNEDPDVDWYLDDPDAHSLAPALARGILHSEEEANGRYKGKTPFDPPRLDAHAHESESWNRLWVSVVMDENNTVRSIRSTPDFSQTRSLIGLDAHPCMAEWQLNTAPYIEKRTVLDTEERQLWRRYERGLLTVQVGDATRPLTSGEYFNEDQMRAAIDDLRREYGSEFRTAITSSAAEEDLKQVMEDAGVQSPETMHYGGEKSRNDFAHERIGLANGCIDPGDGPILDLIAEQGLDAEPEKADVCCEVCGDRDDAPEDPGDGCPDCNGSGWARESGRAFVGPDAETAGALLSSVRESHVAQAAGRYARNPDDPDRHAIVFIRTDATPPGFIDHKVSGTAWTFTEKQREIVRELRGCGEGATAREIAEACDVSKEHVRQTLVNLEDRGKVKAMDRAAVNGATLYRDDGTPRSGVSDVEAAKDGVLDTYTWSLAIQDPDTPEMEERATSATPDADRPTIWPPDEAEKTADPPD